MEAKEFSVLLNKANIISSELTLFDDKGIHVTGEHEFVSVKVESPFSGVLTRNSLSVFKQLRGDIQFEPSPNGVNVRYETGKFRIPFVEKMFFISPPSVEFQSTFSVPGDQLQYGLHCCLKTTNSSMEHLSGVWFTKDYLFSANGNQLTWFPLKTNTQFLLSHQSAQALIPLLTNNDVTIRQGQYVQFETGDTTYTTQVLDSALPNIPLITMPEEHWIVSIDMLQDAVRRCLSFVPEDNSGISLTFKHEKLILHVMGNGEIAEVIPIQGTNHLQITIDGYKLLQLGKGEAKVAFHNGLIFETIERVLITPLVRV